MPPAPVMDRPVRRLARLAYRGLERVLHPTRRRNALRALAEVGEVRSVLTICHGNICRSPFAASLIFRELGSRGLDVVSTSAGFIGPGRQPPAHALAVSERRDIALHDHRSAIVTARAVANADLIVVMAPQQATMLRARFGAVRAPIVILADLDPIPDGRRTILDPWGGDEAAFEESYTRIERCVGQLAQALTGGAGAPEMHQN